MNSIELDNIDKTYNYLILSEKTQKIFDKNYELNINMLESEDIISGMGYNLFEIIELKLKNIIYRIYRLKQNLDSKELAFMLMYESLENSTIYAIKQGEIESIINRYNKKSYAFFPCKTLHEFIKYNNLCLYFTKENLNLILGENNEIIINIYEKFKIKNHELLEEYIEYSKNRINKLIKRK